MKLMKHIGKIVLKDVFSFPTIKRLCTRLGKFLILAGNGILQTVVDFLIEEKCVVCQKDFPLDSGPLVIPPDLSSIALPTYINVKVGIFEIRNRTLCEKCLLTFDRAEKPGILGYVSDDHRVDTVKGDSFCKRNSDYLTSAIVGEMGPLGDSSKPIIIIAPWMTNDSVLSIVHLIKYKSIRSLIQLVADSIFDAFGRFKAGHPQGDFLVPVPSHPEDLPKRGFNHADLIAEALAKKIGIPVRRDVLKKIKRTKRQSQTPSMMRAENVRNAFLSLPLEGENVFLVDDLLTTGSTAASCTASLIDAGAGRVLVFCFGRAL